MQYRTCGLPIYIIPPLHEIYTYFKNGLCNMLHETIKSIQNSSR